MNTVRAQYFLSYAAVGSLTPYLPVYFRQRGLDEAQVGYVLAASSVAVLVTPLLVTFLADARVDARKLMAGLFLAGAATVLGMGMDGGFGLLMGMWLISSLAIQPMVPLQDGINFSIQEKRKLAGQATQPYHRIRVWGTIGFIVPSVGLFVAMWWGAPVGACLVSAGAFSLAGAINALRLPDPRIRELPDPSAVLRGRAPLPTQAALRACCAAPVAVFVLAMFLVHIAVQAYYAFYPIYLAEGLRMDRKWLGLVMNLGVVVEVFFVLSFGWLVGRVGIKGVLVLGCVGIAARLALLAAAPGVAVAVLTQVFHGPQALVLQVLPAVFLDRHAEQRYRHSIQGLYTMVALGGGRIVGNMLAGVVARQSLGAAFAFGAGVSLVAAGLAVLAFRAGAAREGEAPDGGRAPTVGTAREGGFPLVAGGRYNTPSTQSEPE